MSNVLPDEIGRIPTFHIVADSIPQAYYRAMKKVWEEGLTVRTEYDRKNSSGEYIDQPSRDSRFLIEIINPFTDPRYPVISFCEIGKYLAEIMGVKDHLVVPIMELKNSINKELTAHNWTYTYHQRLYSHPDLDGSIVNQMGLAIDRVAETPYTRRAVVSTPVPNLDPYLKEDIPCLREIQFRCVKNADKNLVLNMSTTWRSRDLFKAWGDNVIAMTFLQQFVAREISEKTGRNVIIGSYADYSFSLHIDGQDFDQVGGSEEKGLKSIFEMSEEDYINRSMTSEDARDLLVLPHLKELLTEKEVEQWEFPKSSIEIIEEMLIMLENGLISA